MHIHALVAVSLNGLLASDSQPDIFCKLSTPSVLAIRSRYRSRAQAIFVGARTIILDNPTLLAPNKKNFRIVVDRDGSLNFNRNIFTIRPKQTIIITRRDVSTHYRHQLRRLGVRCVTVAQVDDLHAIMARISRFGIKELLIEGGGKTLAALLARGLIDRMTLAMFPVLLDGRRAPLAKLLRVVRAEPRVTVRPCGRGIVLLTYRFHARES